MKVKMKKKLGRWHSQFLLTFFFLSFNFFLKIKNKLKKKNYFIYLTILLFYFSYRKFHSCRDSNEYSYKKIEHSKDDKDGEGIVDGEIEVRHYQFD